MTNDGGRIWAKRAGLLAAAGVLLLGNLGFFVWYRGTARDRREAMEQRRAGLEKQLQTKEQEAKKLASDRERLSEVRLALDKFYGQSVGLSRETLAGFVDELHTILKRVGVSPAQIGYTTSLVKDPPISQMLVSFNFRGEYGKFKRLLEAIQTDRKWIAIRDIGLARDEEVPGGVQVHISLVTYFSGEEAQTPRAPRAALARGTAR
jgi:Tfp pilus assembly protein PilO